ncbi:malto-oligosyltrehalose synthase [Mycolicibacter minnesotensis]|uniref:Malto-oligosyltrehalose synthase n=1 Tax=Mycolicibacter minnesotensis TaxID=1118379 RepID=A0A7I7RAK2_9MYCO|nr:malto-oligosyltrehalose synthase [Mycolicibacter minnesotensis]ORB03280.1 malto-oligosyltrehalose synthase [Mycolicibacter minnesotensis]BBY35715.1 putative maltooligosyl trehalose synthase [Mycolicibacter minnesotensis]
MVSPVLSTYRLQLRGPAGRRFTFADAENLLDYLDALGISHLYLSPILTPTSGSSHGYDVTDPTTVSADLGGPDGLARLSAAARSRGMGLIVDIVPNHAGVEVPAENPWWWDVLRHGRSSDYAGFFDIDWDRGAGRLVLPVLESDRDLAGLTRHGDTLVVGGLVLPIAPGTGAGDPHQVLDRQHYHLVDWRSGVCGYRRFLTINTLAALRQEDVQVFAATHREVARWFAEDVVDGVRIDHLDGLSDPVGYLRRLRALIGPSAWIIVEKNLATGEALDPCLPVAGTTGYDALRLIGGLFVDPDGVPELSALAAPTAVGPLPTLRTMTAAALANDSQRLLRCVTAATGTVDPRLAKALAALLGQIGVYRCDYPMTEPILPAAIAQAAAAEPELAEPLGVIGAAVAGGGEAAVRLQQLCVAVVAGAVEGSLFHRYARLVSLNEFGGDPLRFGCTSGEFHAAVAGRARHWPDAMTTLSTHDTMRGEDVRARIGVLSQLPGRWAGAVQRWESRIPCPDAATGLFLWQNIFGAWPEDGIVTEALRARLHAYARKAIREAGGRTSWRDPDNAFERAVSDWLDAVLHGPVADELTELVHAVAPHAHSDAVAQKLLALTVPGVPDVYQGTELWEDSLADPDNRRAVDFAACRVALEAATHPKMRVVQGALRARRARPDTFRHGAYRPILAAGPAADHVVGFRRADDVAVAITRWTARLAESGWADTVIALPQGPWIDRLTGRQWMGAVRAAELFAELPGVLLERHHS